MKKKRKADRHRSGGKEIMMVKEGGRKMPPMPLSVSHHHNVLPTLPPHVSQRLRTPLHTSTSPFPPPCFSPLTFAYLCRPLFLSLPSSHLVWLNPFVFSLPSLSFPPRVFYLPPDIPSLPPSLFSNLSSFSSSSLIHASFPPSLICLLCLSSVLSFILLHPPCLSLSLSPSYLPSPYHSKCKDNTYAHLHT